MSHPLYNRSFLGELDSMVEGWSSLLELATQFEADRKAGCEMKRLTGEDIALISEGTSTHIRYSFEVAAYDQGTRVTYLDPSGSQMGHKESMVDTARVLDRFYDGIKFHGKKQKHVEVLAEPSSVPVQNGLMDEWYPTQVLADQLTMLGHSDKPIEQISFVYLDNARNNVANPLPISAALMGADVRMVAPKGLQTSPEVVAQAEELAKDSGVRILVTDDVAQGVKDVDLLYTDVWVSMGEPKEVWDQRVALFASHQVNTQLMEAAGNPGVKFLHCPSALHDHDTTIGEDTLVKTGMEGPEVTDGVFETGHNAAFDQAENRIHTIKAVTVVALGERDRVVRIVVTLRGNALLRRGKKPDASTQIRNVEVVAHGLAELVEKHELVLAHGDGPQVGILVLQSANDGRPPEPYPFNILDVQTQGMIGCWLPQVMQNALPDRHVAAVINQALMMANDPAFSNPTKFIGEVYIKGEAEKLAGERGWVVKPNGEHYHRVVGSPMPQRVIETRLVRTLLDTGAVAVYSRGDSVSVIRSEGGKLKGIEVVIDKNSMASVVAGALEVDALLTLTDVDRVLRNFRIESQKQVPRAAPAGLRPMGFPSGPMGPKVEAVCRFVGLTDDMATIGRLKGAISIIEGRVGIIVTPGGNYGGPDDIHPPIPEQLDTRIRRA